MRVRTAVPADAEAVRAVHFESITGLGPVGYGQEQVDAWARSCASADYASAIESPDGAFVVAEDDRGVVGFGSLSFDPPADATADADAEVTAVYVHPAATREGVGSALLAELERRARERGVRALGLSASLNAVPFYAAHGYGRVREYAHEFSSREGTGVEGTVVEMAKQL